MRNALFASLLALSGCLTECQAIGVGSIGRGTIEDGKVAGGAVGGRPSGVVCTPPGTPEIWYSAAKQSGVSNGVRVDTLTDHGSFGDDAPTEAADYGAIYFSSCGSEGTPCFHFDGNESHSTGAFSGGDVAQPVVWGFLVRPDNASALGYIIDGHNSATKRHAAYQNASPDEWEFFAQAAINTASAPSTANLTRIVWDVDGASSEILIDGSSTGTVNSGGYPLDGLTVGARYNSANKWVGDIAAVIGYTDDSYGTLADLDGYLSCLETINNGSNPNACVALRSAGICPSDSACNIAIIGDSIQKRPGAGSDDLETNLEARLGACATIDSYATSGHSCSQAETLQYDASVDGAGYDLVINNCGVNDITSGTSAADVLSVRESIAAKVLADGSKLLDVSVHPFKNFVSWTSDFQTETDSLNSSLSTPVNAATLYLDTYTVMEDDVTPDALESDYDSGDGLHQNSAGTDAYAEAVYLYLVGSS